MAGKSVLHSVGLLEPILFPQSGTVLGDSGSGGDVSGKHDVVTDAVEVQPGRKLDNGKSPVWQGVIQYFPRALLAIGDVSRYGATKYELSYSDINWSRVPDGYSRYSDALSRHVVGEFIDGPIDPESGLPHPAMAAWNALARLELYLKKIEHESNTG